MDQGPKFQGSLEKQGRMNTWAWKKYWFVLKDGQLTYVKSQEKLACQGHVDLAQAHSVRVVSGSHGFPFEIVTGSRTHNLRASTAEVRSKWVKLLHETMAWTKNLGRKGSINSTRASCNSISDYDDVLEKPVFGSRTSSTPSASSGYSSTSSSRPSSEAPGAATRDSGLEDTMYFNTNYSKVLGPDVASGGSNADAFARNSGKSLVRQSTGDGSAEEEEQLYEDVDRNQARHHQGLRRISVQKPVSARLPSLLTARDSTRSDISDLYAEVDEPMANLAISHIVEGYANIARNKGPQVPPPRSSPPENTEDLYDEVFDTINEPTRKSKVIMRRSSQQRDSEVEGDYDQPYSPGGDTNNDKPASILRNSSTPRRPSSESRVSNRDSKPKPAPKPKPKFAPGSVRRSTLPADVEDYFKLAPIPDLPHPRLELTYRSAFDDIRQFLANNRGPSEIYSSVQKPKSSGEAILNLRSYLSVNT